MMKLNYVPPYIKLYESMHILQIYMKSMSQSMSYMIWFQQRWVLYDLISIITFQICIMLYLNSIYIYAWLHVSMDIFQTTPITLPWVIWFNMYLNLIWVDIFYSTSQSFISIYIFQVLQFNSWMSDSGDSMSCTLSNY